MTTMYIKSISVGLPQKQIINGKEWETAYIKKSVEGLVNVYEDGIEGNQSAVHPDPIYVFPEENYDYWRNKLELIEPDWPSGYFGENLTTVGISENKLEVGDILRIGDNVEVEVTGPRVPCFKLAWRMNQPEEFLQDFLNSIRNGFYLNVRKTGVIQAGDSINIIRKGNHGLSLRRVCKLLSNGYYPNRKELVEALSVSGLSETSSVVLRMKLSRLLDLDLATKDRWNGWKELLVSSVIDETADTKSFVLSTQKQNTLAGFRPGQHITMKYKDESSREIIRTYSISDYGHSNSEYRISIRRGLKGTGSNNSHDVLKVGKIVEVKAPTGRFVLDRSCLEPVVMIGGGIGITPLLSMAKAHAERGKSAPQLFFIHCVRNSSHHAFRDEVREIIETSSKFQSMVIYSSPQKEDKPVVDYDKSDRLRIDWLKELLVETYVIYCGKRISIPWTDCCFYICGPADFQNYLIKSLVDSGVNNSHIKTESFLPTSGNSIGEQVDKANVFFSRSGKSVVWSRNEDQTLLDLAESLNIKTPNSCRIGVCQTCECKLVDGSVYYDYQPKSLPDNDRVLICCAKPGSKNITLEL